MTQFNAPLVAALQQSLPRGFRWFPKIKEFKRDPDGLSEYLRFEFKRHCHRQHKKRLAKKIIARGGYNLKTSLTVEYRSARMYHFGMVMAEPILDALDRPGFARRILPVTSSSPQLS